jgi:hypothetical protein
VVYRPRGGPLPNGERCPHGVPVDGPACPACAAELLSEDDPTPEEQPRRPEPARDPRSPRPETRPETAADAYRRRLEKASEFLDDGLPELAAVQLREAARSVDAGVELLDLEARLAEAQGDRARAGQLRIAAARKAPSVARYLAAARHASGDERRPLLDELAQLGPPRNDAALLQILLLEAEDPDDEARFSRWVAARTLADLRRIQASLGSTPAARMLGELIVRAEGQERQRRERAAEERGRAAEALRRDEALRAADAARWRSKQEDRERDERRKRARELLEEYRAECDTLATRCRETAAAAPYRQALAEAEAALRGAIAEAESSHRTVVWMTLLFVGVAAIARFLVFRGFAPAVADLCARVLVMPVLPFAASVAWRRARTLPAPVEEAFQRARALGDATLAEIATRTEEARAVRVKGARCEALGAEVTEPPLVADLLDSGAAGLRRELPPALRDGTPDVQARWTATRVRRIGSLLLGGAVVVACVALTIATAPLWGVRAEVAAGEAAAAASNCDAAIPHFRRAVEDAGNTGGARRSLGDCVLQVSAAKLAMGDAAGAIATFDALNGLSLTEAETTARSDALLHDVRAAMTANEWAAAWDHLVEIDARGPEVGGLRPLIRKIGPPAVRQRLARGDREGVVRMLTSRRAAVAFDPVVTSEVLHDGGVRDLLAAKEWPTETDDGPGTARVRLNVGAHAKLASAGVTMELTPLDRDACLGLEYTLRLQNTGAEPRTVTVMVSPAGEGYDTHVTTSPGKGCYYQDGATPASDRYDVAPGSTVTLGVGDRRVGTPASHAEIRMGSLEIAWTSTGAKDPAFQ